MTVRFNKPVLCEQRSRLQCVPFAETPVYVAWAMFHARDGLGKTLGYIVPLRAARAVIPRSNVWRRKEGRGMKRVQIDESRTWRDKFDLIRGSMPMHDLVIATCAARMMSVCEQRDISSSGQC